MDQPTARIRRHNSLPGRMNMSVSLPLPRMSHHMKFNPYVGWFRHSPDTSRRFPPALNFSPLPSSLKMIVPFQNAPYLPNSFCCAKAAAILKQMQDDFLTLMEVTRTMKVTSFHVQELADFLAGRLRGGSPHSEMVPGKESSYMHRCPQHSNALHPRFLTRLVSWILTPLLLEDEKHEKIDIPSASGHSSLRSLDNDSLTTDCDHLPDQEQDDYTHHRSMQYNEYNRQTPENMTLTFSRSNSIGGEHSSMAAQKAVSSQAEAYYAHQAAMDSIPGEVIPSRLDYVITQMDIIRMQRNASRHLDVKSICQLPTVTYLKSNGNNIKNACSNSQQEDSWMIVPHAKSTILEEQGHTSTKLNQNGNEDDYNANIDVCIICLDHFVMGDRLRVLPCNHAFHIGCIDRWLSGSASFDECNTSGCPTCKKRPILEHGGMLQSGEDEEPQELRADGFIPPWAFCQLGSALLARDSKQTLDT